MALSCVEYTHEHMGEKRRDAQGTTLQTTRPLSLGNWVSTTGLMVLMSLSRTVYARIVLYWRSFSWNLLARLLLLAVDIVTHVCTRLVASKLHICLSISSSPESKDRFLPAIFLDLDHIMRQAPFLVAAREVCACALWLQSANCTSLNSPRLDSSIKNSIWSVRLPYSSRKHLTGLVLWPACRDFKAILITADDLTDDAVAMSLQHNMICVLLTFPFCGCCSFCYVL